MNPYGKLFGDERDLAAVLLLSLLVTVVGACLAKRLLPLRRSEGYLCGASWALLLLNATILAVGIIGLIGFALQIKSVLWEIWSLFYFVGVIGVFKVFPVMGIGLLAWWKVGRNYFSYSKQLRPTIIMCFLLNSLCAITLLLQERLT